VTDNDFDWLYRGGDPTPAPEEPAPRVPRAQPPAAVPPPQPSPPREPAPAPPAKPKAKTRIKAKRVVIVIAVVLALWVSFLVYAPLHAWYSTPKVGDVPTGARPPQQPGTAILLVGTDSRDDLTPEQQQQLGVGPGDIGSRTDVMMIYYIPPHGKPALISLPRDSYLPIPGNGKNKLNAAYAFGGPSLLVATVEQATGLRMDGYLEIGFGGLVQLVDLVGGVQVCLDKPVNDPLSALNLPAGCQTLNGATALGYVRQRHQDPLGDLGRVQRQREVLSKVVAKLASPWTVLNPVRYWKVCQSITQIVTRGQDTGFGDLTAGTIGALTVARGDAYSLTVPISNAGASTPAGSSVLWDDAKAAQMFAMLAKGDTSQLGQFG